MCKLTSTKNRPFLSSTPTHTHLHTTHTRAHAHVHNLMHTNTLFALTVNRLTLTFPLPLFHLSAALTVSLPLSHLSLFLSHLSLSPAHPSPSLCLKSRKLCSFCSSSSGGCAAGHESVRAEVRDGQLSQRGCSDGAAPRCLCSKAAQAEGSIHPGNNRHLPRTRRKRSSWSTRGQQPPCTRRPSMAHPVPQVASQHSAG